MSDYIPTHDCWHWIHYWESPWTQQVTGGLLPATPPNAGFFGNGPPVCSPLTSITGNPRTRTAADAIRPAQPVAR